MEEQMYKIVVAGTTTQPIEGCESMTLSEVETWLHANQEHFDEPIASGDTVKYVFMPVEFTEDYIPVPSQEEEPSA